VENRTLLTKAMQQIVSDKEDVKIGYTEFSKINCKKLEWVSYVNYDVHGASYVQEKTQNSEAP
jgi:hypothetical protein